MLSTTLRRQAASLRQQRIETLNGLGVTITNNVSVRVAAADSQGVTVFPGFVPQSEGGRVGVALTEFWTGIFRRQRAALARHAQAYALHLSFKTDAELVGMLKVLNADEFPAGRVEYTAQVCGIDLVQARLNVAQGRQMLEAEIVMRAAQDETTIDADYAEACQQQAIEG